MHKSFVLLFAITALTSSAQKILAPKTIHLERDQHFSLHNYVKSISPLTAVLLIKTRQFQKRLIIDSSLVRTYSIVTENNVQYVNAFIAVTNEFDLTDISAFGFLPGTIKKNLITGLIPLTQIENVANHPNVKYVSTGEAGAPAMDSAKKSTRADLVQQGYQLPQSYNGDGVVVGVVDAGLDYTHPNFYDSTGKNNYRIKRVWEQFSSNGIPPAGYSYGRELLTETAILNAQRDIATYSHGTHVAGIAAGAGGGLGFEFRGIAPNADIVLVSCDGNAAKLLDGIAYIMDYAALVHKPCVINLSWGSHIGPHDGTSAFDQGCDLLAGPGKIIVGAAGNQGADSIYIGKSFSAIDTSLFSFVRFPNSSKGTNGQTVVDVWGVANENFKVAVNIYNIATDQYEASTGYYPANVTTVIVDTLYDVEATPDSSFITISTGINPLNSKPHAMLTIDHSKQDNTNKYIQIEITAKNTGIKAWAAGSTANFSALGYNGNILGGSTSSTVGELGGTGNSIISVGAYTSLNTYTALNGTTQTTRIPTPVGAIAPFSSKGPTADGRVKPDITAPGNAVISSVNRFDNVFTSSSNLVAAKVTSGSTNWFFAVNQGTSMSTPMVTGTVALWLQADPTLTSLQVKTYLEDSAITDNFTGIIPTGGSNTWGYGKVDAYRGLKKVLNSIVYTFNGNGNWDDPSNWTNNIVPPGNLMAGSIMIDHTAGGKCILNVGQVISPNSNLTIKTGRNLVIQGPLTIQQ